MRESKPITPTRLITRNFNIMNSEVLATARKSQITTACVLAALALGTAWAVRGKFGHEQGAAWAGAIGCIGLVLIARRTDWYNRLFELGLAGAFGWGLSGMISYGMVVGYARADDFININYGLQMLFVIGCLYGFLGGGIFALALSNTREDRVPWAVLITEMVGFALLAYGLIVNQLGWLMTPPRSELWAACLGACIPIAWYAVRTNKRNVLRVAVWSALGAGWGFAFGNFLQVMANSVGFPINPWNIMEYSIGFFGGLGMAYSILTSTWPVLEEKPASSQKLPAILLLLAIPLTVFDQSFNPEQMDHITKAGGPESLIGVFQWIAVVAILVVAALIWKMIGRPFDYESVRNVFILYLGSYILLSFLLTGILIHPVEQYLYIVNLAVILMVAARMHIAFDNRDERTTRWLVATAFCVLAVTVLTVIVLGFNTKMMDSVGRF